MPVGWAQSPAAEPPRVDSQRLLALQIPAQDLAQALEVFSRATGMAVLVDRELARGRRSVGINGHYSAREGLSRLLVGTGLMARYARSDAFTLQVPQVTPAAAQQGAGASRAARLNSSYASALQRAVERSLCRSALTRPGSFRAVLQLWVSADGAVQHSRLVSSTGDRQRDEALVQRLAQARVERPAPSSLRQPLTLLLIPDTTGTRMDCKEWEGASGV
ncbi:secretin and TonB N-terminal domain-containing protein [Pseudomonas sp. Au-Pse12]|uniref:secretin and TonB N-terminal domain-containing protein n=1 Tax=Pseudomonas sp. Au-Pse12 TaxID=2906459 RepID=UPI001E539E7C|nr:secretin and TonB N-terminal domain-containing protein [Pseudomonas sp. Au-Pse12]MCE4053122.1 TonB C-terminal domain-containing protein [Pseudomonas sp. Au-Pse12]